MWDNSELFCFVSIWHVFWKTVRHISMILKKWGVGPTPSALQTWKVSAINMLIWYWFCIICVLGFVCLRLWRNALWPQNLVRRIPYYWSEYIDWVKDHVESSKFNRSICFECLVTTKFSQKNPWPKRNQFMFSRSCRVHPRSTWSIFFEYIMTTKFDHQNPWLACNTFMESKVM